MKKINLFLTLSLLILFVTNGFSQRKSKTPVSSKPDVMSEETFKGLKLRNIGPAFMSGRIGDIAIHPEDDNIWYVGV
ncbi:MAG: hypothetical protein U9N53_15415, partial [Bacteroidota bacterium]|nr:hypothetical protein [Bacteroidota bacterium]